jgi:hypothetical protein
MMARSETLDSMFGFKSTGPFYREESGSSKKQPWKQLTKFNEKET